MVLKSELPEFEDMRPLQEIIADCKNLQHNCRHIIETDFFSEIKVQISFYSS